MFASSNPQRSGPYKSREILVNKYPQALQHFSHKTIGQASWGERVRDHAVMDIISVDEVKQKIDELNGE